ncbi:MAG: HEAT repeat domain-containing protein, partial [Planctomycetota bacterium]
EPPAGIDGRDFLSAKAGDPPAVLWGHRSRMDERLDLVRSVFDGRFVLIRNFHLQRPHGQHVAYQFETSTTRIWKGLFDRGKLNAVQSRFWMPREAEELYDLDADPHETVNLADSPARQADADRLRRLLRERILKTRDLGFVPEGMLETMRGANAPLEWGARDSNYPLEKLLEAALLAARKEGEAGRIMALAGESHPGLRYWAATGAACRPGESATLRPMLLGLLADASPSVRVAAADALARTSRPDTPKAREILLAAASVKENGLPTTLEALNALDAMGRASPEELTRLEKGLAGADKVNPRLRSYTERLMESLRRDR